jgi:FlaG/FlaF family flagellin (archaellin)
MLMRRVMNIAMDMRAMSKAMGMRVLVMITVTIMPMGLLLRSKVFGRGSLFVIFL